MELDWAEVDRIIDQALAEDIGRGDLTTAVAVPAGAQGVFTMNARGPLILAGMDVAARVFRRLAPDCEVKVVAADGTQVMGGSTLARIAGPAQPLLTAERTALNFVQLLSGIATHAHAFVTAVQGTGAVMVDTRKTIPGLRALSKYAARMGGVRNHRLRLDDGVLIKDNHIAIAGGVRAAVEGVRMRVPLLTKIEVECETFEQLEDAIAAGADLAMLDNMAPDALRRAVEIAAGRIPLEASGGITLATVRAVAETGVDYISSGRITQTPPAADIGLDVAITA